MKPTEMKLSEQLHCIGTDIATYGRSGLTLDWADLARLGAFLVRAAHGMRRLEVALDEIVKDAWEDEQARARSERFQPVLATIIAGIPTFREPDHIKDQGDSP